MRARAAAAAAAALLLAAAAPARDWAELLRRDAQALHDDVASNHPGPLDRANPGFAAANDRGLALALRRAGRVRDYPGYLFAMNAYVASFDDGHLGMAITDKDVRLPYRWAGVLTAFDGAGVQRVVSREADAPMPLGARLIGCDRRAADRLAAETVGAFEGRWQLASQQRRAGHLVLVDRGNPFVRLPVRCTFEVDGRPRTVRLAWRAATAEALEPRFAAARQRVRPPIEDRTLADGTRWIGISSFNGSPSSAAGTALPGIIARLGRDRAALAAAPAIVFDLRGNTGGSSDWSYQIAAVLWGRAATDRASTASDAVDWRASASNLASLEASLADQSAGGNLSPDGQRWFGRVIAGIGGAVARGQTFWRDDEPSPAPSDEPAPPPLGGPVYLLTDEVCASACLDAADLWLALGAVLIGRQTSADTAYMDVRMDPLPSGLGTMVVPMKVYRGRKRGNNEPLTPRITYPGDMTDTAALQGWVASLRR